jgi:hypothetical protein
MEEQLITQLRESDFYRCSTCKRSVSLSETDQHIKDYHPNDATCAFYLVPKIGEKLDPERLKNDGVSKDWKLVKEWNEHYENCIKDTEDGKFYGLTRYHRNYEKIGLKGAVSKFFGERYYKKHMFLDAYDDNPNRYYWEELPETKNAPYTMRDDTLFGIEVISMFFLICGGIVALPVSQIIAIPMVFIGFLIFMQLPVGGIQLILEDLKIVEIEDISEPWEGGYVR